MRDRVHTFILAEAELEVVPQEIRSHSGIRHRARNRHRDPSEMVLDQAMDHAAMRNLADGERRGRPDIVHFFLLLVQDSLLVSRGLARVLIHTRNDELIRVRPDTRIMRSQNQFIRLTEDLLRQGEVPHGNPLLTVEPGRTLKSVLDAEAQGARVLLDLHGAPMRTPDFARMASQREATVVMGGFPRGSFRQARPEWFDVIARVAPEELTVWSALVPVLAGFEDAALRDAT